MTLPLLPGGSVPAAVDALVTAVRAALPEPDADDGVEVFDGPDPTRAFAPRAVTVAAAFEDDQDAVSVDRVASGAGRHVTETLDVACSAYVGTGETDGPAIDEHRQTMGEILAAIDAKLRADPTLGDAVARAALQTATWLQGRDENGSGVIVGFVVQLVVFS